MSNRLLAPRLPRPVHLRSGLLLAGLLGFMAPAHADDGWEHSLLIYLLGPNIDGTTGIGPADLDVSVDPGSVFDALEMGFLGMYFAEKDGYGLLADVVYMDLGVDLEGPGGNRVGKLGNKQLISMLSGTWRLNEHWQLTGGVAYTNVDMDLRVNGPVQTRTAERTEDWWDPIVGAVYRTEISQRWNFSGYGVVGGFGVGSDLLWSLNASVGFEMTDRTSLVLAYRYIDYDYEDGSGAERFKFDMAEYGPALGVRWDF